MTGLHILIDAINDNAVPRGPDRYLLELLPHLLAADAEVRLTLLHAHWQQAFRTLARHDRLAIVEVAAPRSPAGRLIWHMTRFASLARRYGPDVVFLPNLIWTPRLRTPSVVTAHDLLHFRTPEKFGHVKSALLRRVIRLALRRADRVIAVSEFTAADARRFGDVPAARLRTVLEGGPEPRSRDGHAEARHFLFVGKIERTKGVTDLIEAFAGSSTLADADYRLVLVGPDGNASADVRANMARLDATTRGRIEQLGFVDEETLDRLYLSTRGFIFPSVSEGFGLVLLEAMARGAPVIAARATSLPEVVADAGLLVAPGGTVELREAMERLASDDALCCDLRERGYRRLTAFSWERAGGETMAIFREVAR